MTLDRNAPRAPQKQDQTRVLPAMTAETLTWNQFLEAAFGADGELRALAKAAIRCALNHDRPGADTCVVDLCAALNARTGDRP